LGAIRGRSFDRVEVLIVTGNQVDRSLSPLLWLKRGLKNGPVLHTNDFLEKNGFSDKEKSPRDLNPLPNPHFLS
jgi:hypothetical protein